MGALFIGESMANAWRRFVSTGYVDESVVRGEVACSWRRCRQSGLSPWTVETRKVDEARLIRARREHGRLIRAADPVMSMLSALLDSNVSLMDEDSFVYHLVSPFESYPRALGTTMDEAVVGTCNAVLVRAENRPVRCDYFEHYKVGSQAYSAAAAPFLHDDGSFGGALLLNSPLKPLPARAPIMAAVAARLVKRLFLLDRKMLQALSSMAFFSPLIQLCEEGVAITNEQGCLLSANDVVGGLCGSWASAPYGSDSLGKYLVGGDKTLRAVLERGEGEIVRFKRKRGREPIEMTLLAARCVDLGDGKKARVLRFGNAGQQEVKQGSTDSDSIPAARPKHRPIGQSEKWLAVDRMVRRVAPIKVSVLLLGETGTGKEVMAKAIHDYSGRKGEFVAINCGAIPKDLMASELFGYEPGAFTGAQAKGLIGKFEYAHGGTVFLDEIGEMPYDMQVGLLRVLQEQSIVRLGSNEVRDLDIRFVAATNQNLDEAVSEKRFRLDLYHRLSQIEIVLPPLRERKEDIPLFVDSFNKELCGELQLPYSPFSSEAIEAFLHLPWFGNVRELRNVVERCLIFCGQGSEVDVHDVMQHAAADRCYGVRKIE